MVEFNLKSMKDGENNMVLTQESERQVVFVEEPVVEESADIEFDIHRCGNSKEAKQRSDNLENNKDIESDNEVDKSKEIESDEDKEQVKTDIEMSLSDYPDLTSEFSTDRIFESKDQVRDWCINRGLDCKCVIVTKRSRMKNVHGNGKGSRMDLVCERSGQYVDHKSKNYVPISSQKKRRTCSRKCDCPFELHAHCRCDGTWILTVKNGRHNHTLPNVLTGHPFVARLNEDELKTVATMTNSGVKPRNILTAIRIDNPSNQPTIRTVYNAKIKLKMCNTEGRSVMQQFMKLASTNNYTVYQRVDEQSNEITDLFFSHPRCVVLAQCFYQILFLDCTFKTNRYKLPCFHMVSQTSTGATFTVALAFLSRETTDSYKWALECVRKCYRDTEVPGVIITDAEIALINAVANVFPASYHILCAWHISKNVMANCKPNFIQRKRVIIGEKEVVVEDDEGKKEYESFWEGWTNVINSLSVEEYHRNLNSFRDKWIGKHKKSVTYVLKNWLTKYKEMFVMAWTNKIKHYDNVSTSIVESAHYRLKLYFNLAAGSFVQCWSSAHLCCENELVAIEHAFETSTSKTMHRFRIEPMFKELLGKVSHKALDLILTELKSVSTVGMTVDQCGCVLWKVNGLPCAHMLVDFRHTHGFIPLSVVDSYWKQLSCIPPIVHRSTFAFFDLPEIIALKNRYEESPDNVRLVIQQQLKSIAFPQTTAVLEPPVATIKKGRPSKKEHSTKRELSHFEHVEASLSSSSNLTPCGRYLKKLGIKTKASPSKKIDGEYLCQLPKHIRAYILSIDDVPRDGDCGYWVVVKQLNLQNRRPSNPCKFVRESMVDNLTVNAEMYRNMWDDCGYDEMMNRIQNPEWMQMPESGYIIAETFGTVVVLISNLMSCTFVPTTVRMNLLNQNRIVVMGHVDNSHYVGLTLTPNSPIPPTPQFGYFQRLYNINAEDWIKPYVERINKWLVYMNDGGNEDQTSAVDLTSV